MNALQAGGDLLRLAQRRIATRSRSADTNLTLASTTKREKASRGVEAVGGAAFATTHAVDPRWWGDDGYT